MPDPKMEDLVVELSEFIRQRYFGKYRGLVQDVNDPEKLGRLRAQVPGIYENDDSPWAWPAVPFAGSNHGLVLLPEVGDGVWIEFEAGDPSLPIWTGCWWAKNELPPPGGTAARVLVTSKGHKLILDDDNDKIQLIHAGGAEFTMSANDITLKIGNSQIVLSASGVSVNNGALEVK
jgi:uncharacterized protein involved in type VI secretion and phage assembly